MCCLCASASPACFRTCSLWLNIKMRDRNAKKSRVWLSHSSIPIYFTDSEHSTNKQRYTWLPQAVFEGRYFEVALKFLWSSREQPKIQKRPIWTWVGEKTLRGRSKRGDQGILDVWNELETRSGYTTQHNLTHCLSDILLALFSDQGFIVYCSSGLPQGNFFLSHERQNANSGCRKIQYVYNTQTCKSVTSTAGTRQPQSWVQF